jgi:hypothetical protein
VGCLTFDVAKVDLGGTITLCSLYGDSGAAATILLLRATGEPGGQFCGAGDATDGGSRNVFQEPSNHAAPPSVSKAAGITVRGVNALLDT